MSFILIDYCLYDFVNCCYIGLSFVEMVEMLEIIGVDSFDVLIEVIVFVGICQVEELNFGKLKFEGELLYFFGQVVKKNKVMMSLIGQGFYGMVMLFVIQWNIFENLVWYIVYILYQFEIL